MWLLHVVDHLHELPAQFVGLSHGLSLAIDADDGLGVRLAQMYPTVREIDLYAVDVVDLSTRIGSKEFLHFHKDGVDIGLGGEVNAILGYLLVGESLAQLTGCAALLGAAGEEEDNAYKGIAAIVAFGIDDTTVAFAADDSPHFLHLRGDVDLADGCGGVLPAVLLCHVAQGTGGGEVGDGVT